MTIPRFFGQYLLGQGLVTAPQLLAAVEYQNRSNSRLGEFAVERGLATPFEVEQIRALQAKEDRLFGEAAIRMRVLTADQVYQMLIAQQGAHLELGQALVDLGFLGREDVDQAAAAFISAEQALEPEVFTLPADLPHTELLTELLYLAHKLLLRVCNLVSKPGAVRVTGGGTATSDAVYVPLSDANVRVATAGALDGALLLCVPHGVALDCAKVLSGEEDPDESHEEALVLELSQILADNLVSALAERGMRLRIETPQVIEPRPPVAPGTRVALVPFVTHRGQVLVGIELSGTAAD